MRESRRWRWVPRRRGLLRVAFALMMLGWVVGPNLASAAVEMPAEGWSFVLAQCDSEGGVGIGQFVSGPGITPLGHGSFQFGISWGNPLPELRQADYNGTLLSDLSALTYSTFVSGPGTHPVAPYVLIDVDLDGDGGLDDQLVFQPAVQATVAGQTWQRWDALNGSWYSRQGNAGLTASMPGALDDYLAAFPDAVVADTADGGLRIATGCLGGPWLGFVGAVDAVTVGAGDVVQTYDFEANGIRVTESGGDEVIAGLAVFDALFPAPFSTSTPGQVRVAARASADSTITDFSMTLNGQPLDVEIGGPDGRHLTAFTEQRLTAGVYTASATATTAAGAFTAEWDFVVSSDLADGEWFTASGQPRADQINATMRSLVEAFRWHLFGQSWDGKAHPEMPTHADAVSQGAALETWVNGTTFNQGATEATLKSLVEAFRWHFWGISWDNQAHPEIPTHASSVLPAQDIAPWFTADGKPIPENIDATMRSLVEAFRWHFWGSSWDGQPHFSDMPTHKPY